MDVFDKTIFSWKISHNKNLISSFHNFIDDAIKQFGKANIIHSDNGFLFTTIATNKKFNKLNIKQSFSETYKPWKNRRMGKWFGTLKNVCLDFKDLNIYDYDEKQQRIIKFINFYNTKKYHDGIK